MYRIEVYHSLWSSYAIHTIHTALWVAIQIEINYMGIEEVCESISEDL